MTAAGGFQRPMGARIHEATVALARVLADLEAARDAENLGRAPPAEAVAVCHSHVATAAEIRGHMRVSGHDFAPGGGGGPPDRGMDIGIVSEGLGHARRRGPASPLDRSEAATVRDRMAERGYGVVAFKP